MKLRNIAVRFGQAAVGLGTTAGVALADAPDYTVVTSAVVVGGIVAAILGMAAIKVAPNVARWAGNKLANFF